MEKEKIQTIAFQALADAFLIDLTQVEASTTQRLREDMGASSMQYLPLISTLEEECNISLDLHEFQNEARTVMGVVDYVYAQYNKQHS